METLAIVALVVLVVWLLARGRGDTPVVRSALNALLESESLCLNAWMRLRDMLVALGPERRHVCYLMTMVKRSDLPAELDQLWGYLDDITDRSNRAAEHYENVSGKPAPPSRARAFSDDLMQIVREEATTYQRGADRDSGADDDR